MTPPSPPGAPVPSSSTVERPADQSRAALWLLACLVVAPWCWWVAFVGARGAM